MTTAAHTPGPWFVAAERGCAFQIADNANPSLANILCTRFDWEEKAEEMAANARLIASAPDLLSEIEREYAEIADIHNNWPGRSTMNGQAKLCRLRDLIAAATGRSGQDVQDDYGARNAIARAAIAKATGSAA